MSLTYLIDPPEQKIIHPYLQNTTECIPSHKRMVEWFTFLITTIDLMDHPKTDSAEPEQDLLTDGESRRRVTCQRIVIENVFWSASVGLVPVPLVDVVGISAIQLKMLNELSIEYGIKFSRNRAKALITALGSGAGMMAVSSFKLIPGIGTAGSGVGMSVLGGALTYAVGTLFVEHFETGGTLEDLDLNQARKRMETLTEEGKRVASEQQR